MTKVFKLRKREVPYEDMQVSVERLAFYPENPRIYSQFAGSGDRTQENIQAKLEGMNHVKELRSQIDRDGQVNEPLFCIRIVDPGSELYGEYEYQVLEGNSRLAALRINKKGSLPPARVPCNVLDFSAYSEQETESLIFSLLGQFHIIGKAGWRSYENAAYIYRRFKNHRVPVDDIAKEISLTPAKVRQMVNAFQMMIDAGDDNTARWSYYEVCASSTKLRNKRESDPNLDDRLVSLIKADKFPRALDMRDKLPDILSSKRARRIFFDEDEIDPFGEALAVADISGDTDKTFKRVQRFRNDLATNQTRTQIHKLLRSDSSRGKIEYELTHIVKSVNQLLDRAKK